jgi:hypothetical protein
MVKTPSARTESIYIYITDFFSFRFIA